MEKGADNSFGIASVVLAILSIAFAPGVFLIFAYGPFLSIILGIVALVFALKQKKKSPNAWSKAGLILSIIGIVLGVVLAIWLINLMTKVLEGVQQLQESGALTQQLPQGGTIPSVPA